MKKLTKVLAPVALAAALGACEPAKNVDTVAPVVNSVGAVKPGQDKVSQTLANVFLEIAPHINNLDHGFLEVPDGTDFDEKDAEQEAKIKAALKAVFPVSSMRKFMNFDEKYLNSVIDEVSITVARACGCHPVTYNGFFSNEAEHIQIASRTASDPQGGTAENAMLDSMALLHEMGHALGLGERLAQYFAEKMLGAGVVSPNVQKYNTMYDRELENRMGEKAFWKTAFSTEEKYRQAWDKHMGDIMPYYEFLDVLSVSDMLREGRFVENEHEKSPVLQQFPEEKGNQSIYDIRTFQSLFTDYLAGTGEYKANLNGLMKEYAGKMHTIAEHTALPTDRAVLDGYAPPRGMGAMEILEALNNGIPTGSKVAVLLMLMVTCGYLPLETLKMLSGRKERYINFSRNGIRFVDKERKL